MLDQVPELILQNQFVLQHQEIQHGSCGPPVEDHSSEGRVNVGLFVPAVLTDVFTRKQPKLTVVYDL